MSRESDESCGAFAYLDNIEGLPAKYDVYGATLPALLATAKENMLNSALKTTGSYINTDIAVVTDTLKHDFTREITVKRLTNVKEPFDDICDGEIANITDLGRKKQAKENSKTNYDTIDRWIRCAQRDIAKFKASPASWILKGDIKEVATLVRCDGKSTDEKEAQYDALRKAWKQARMMEAVIEQFSEVFKKLREHEGIGS